MQSLHWKKNRRGVKMRDLYIKPQVEFKEFDILDIVKCSPTPVDPTEKPGQGSGNNNDDDWSHLY